jgi:hypothetical protein
MKVKLLGDDQDFESRKGHEIKASDERIGRTGKPGNTKG